MLTPPRPSEPQPQVQTLAGGHPARRRSLEAAGRAWAGPVCSLLQVSGCRGGPAAPREEQPVARVQCCSRVSL